MWTIRPEQMEAFARSAYAAFEDNMVQMVEQRYPEKTCNLSNQQLRVIIGSGMIRAKQYEINLTHDVERFLRLMFRLPSIDFEEDPLTSWTKADKGYSYG